MIPISRLLWLLVALAPDAAAAWVGLCNQTPFRADVRVLDTLLRPVGGTTALIAADRKLPDCAMTEIPVAKERVRWIKVVPHEQAAALAEGIILKGLEGDTGFISHEVVPLRYPATPAPLLPGGELIPRLQSAPFGIEGRATVRHTQSRIAIECTSGNSPAGALISGRGNTLPPGASLALRIAADAEGSFRFGAVDAEHDRRGEPLVLGAIGAGKSAQEFKLPPHLEAATWRSWVVECPMSAAQLDIDSLRLEPLPAVQPAPRRALWVWQPETWQRHSAGLLDLLATNAANTVFISVPVLENQLAVAEPDALMRFVARATVKGIRVWVVAGDPRAVLPHEQARYAARARAYATYNRDVPAGARLAGIQLDIEPYLNSGYTADIEGWLSAYLSTLSTVRDHAQMPLDIAVPFWWGRQRYRNGTLLDHLAPIIDVVTVMNYRTDHRQLLEFAEPFLAWGTRAQRQVRIGLESGPIPDESMLVFRPREDGELWLVPHGKHALVLMLDRPRKNPAGHAFSYSHTTRWTGSNITFRDHVATLRELLPLLEKTWRAWPSFSGIALHGLDAD